jgi:hypothetical protein
VDVGFDVFGRLALDDEVHVGDVETARSHVGRHEDVETAFLKAAECDFSLLLRDVAMQDLDVLQLLREIEFVGLGLGLGEDDGLAEGSAVAKD